MNETKRELSELLRRHDLLRSVLIAGKVPDAGFRLDAYVDRVLEMASRIWNKAGKMRNDSVLTFEIMRGVVFEEFGCQGKGEKTKEVFDDPQRYFLHRVLDGGQSCNLSMALLYAILAEQVGVSYECVVVPNQYFLKIKDVAQDFYVYPYDNGKLLNQEEFQKKFRITMNRSRMLSTSLFEKLTPYELIGRVFQQLKHTYILKGNALEALRAVEMLTTLYPQSVELTRDRGILYCEMEYFSKAIVDLKAYLKQRPNADDIPEIKKLTSMIKGYREIVN